jgi:hypothetical protein
MRSAAACWASLAALAAAAATLADPARAPDEAAAPDPAGVEELLRRMAGARGVVARFVERKELALLAAPLESRGTLYFVPPDRLARFTTSPAETELRIEGEELHFRDATGREELDLSASPLARAFVENFVAIFRGDAEKLRERYELGLARDGERWELVLTPRGAPLDRFVAGIFLRGDRGGMREMELRERDGDRTVTSFEAVDLDHAFSQAELSRLFPHGPQPEPEAAREPAGRP